MIMQEIMPEQRENFVWAEKWAKYLTKSLVKSSENADVILYISQLFMAKARGDSCVRCTEQQAQQLGSLVSMHSAQVAPFIFDGQALFLYRYFALEQRLAHQVQRLIAQQPTQVDTSSYLSLLPDPYQQQALQMVGQSALNMITGGPGTGKTYTLARIVAVLNHCLPHLRIAMAAPTGKAAQRMQEALQLSFSDPDLQQQGLIQPELLLLKPVTLHRLLGIGRQGQAKFTAQQPLPYDLIIVDEASMLDLNLATLLFEAIPDHARLILLGDAQQLASVDVGSVLADLQQPARLQPYRVNLLNSRRFSDDALIGKMARFIQQVTTRQLNTEQVLSAFEQDIVAADQLQIVDLNRIQKDLVQLQYLNAETAIEQALQQLWSGFEDYTQSLLAYLQGEQSQAEVEQVIACFDHYRILTAIHHGEFGLERINQFMQQQLLKILLPYTQAVGDWYIGRPVMMTENDDQLGLANGDIGICFFQKEDHQQFSVFFPSLQKWVIAQRLPKNIATAFALTIHKSQGSEFAHTAVVLDAQAEKLLSQELIYTAITRAKKAVSLLVDRAAFAQALTCQTVRHSGLIRKIEQSIE